MIMLCSENGYITSPFLFKVKCYMVWDKQYIIIKIQLCELDMW